MGTGSTCPKDSLCGTRVLRGVPASWILRHLRGHMRSLCAGVELMRSTRPNFGCQERANGVYINNLPYKNTGIKRSVRYPCSTWYGISYQT